MIKKLSDRKLYLTVTAFFLGLLIVLQSRSFETVSEQFLRDSQSNIFQEIKILKEKNEDLKKEIADLENTSRLLEDQNSALDAVQDQIDKYLKLSGRTAVFGPGLEISINGNLSTPWMIDLINEFFNSGADAVSVNGIRIVNRTVGFDTLPQGQILLNGSILSSPYIFNVIGESSTLKSILESPAGIFERLNSALPGLKIQTVSKEIIQMEANL